MHTDDDLNAFFRGLDDGGHGTSERAQPTYRKASEPRPEDRHICLECNGTGVFPGFRVHQEKEHCFACKGKGWFKKSYADRQRKREQVAARKEKKAADAKAAWMEAHPGVIEGLKGMASWSQFAASMLEGFEKYHSLTEKQLAAAQSMIAKVAVRQAEKSQAKKAGAGEVSVAAIEAMFATAMGNGLQRPAFITERLRISLAPAHGKNAGALYVKADGEYAGKIAGGRLYPAYGAPKDLIDIVREVAADPIGAARLYGKKTGTCACCGRELTDPVSIENGIGPICESKWF